MIVKLDYKSDYNKLFELIEHSSRYLSSPKKHPPSIKNKPHFPSPYLASILVGIVNGLFNFQSVLLTQFRCVPPLVLPTVGVRGRDSMHIVFLSLYPKGSVLVRADVNQ